jgi:hypothetical protein
VSCLNPDISEQLLDPPPFRHDIMLCRHFSTFGGNFPRKRGVGQQSIDGGDDR